MTLGVGSALSRHGRVWTRLLPGLVLVLVVLAAALYGINYRVVSAASPWVYTDLEQLPGNQVGLVLGTSNYTRGGQPNQLFAYRIKAAVQLYRAGKVRQLLVSGANPSAHYNEPRQMFQALVNAGIPAEAITMDFAGFRTLDSVVRANKVFGLRSYTIISQHYHVFRAVYIARAHHIHAVAYAAPSDNNRLLLRTRVREFFARIMAFIDVQLGTQPRFLGQPVPIVGNA